jgi:hypothetical protein
MFLDLRDAAARILEHSTMVDIAGGLGAESARSKKRRKKKETEVTVLPIVVHGSSEKNE